MNDPAKKQEVENLRANLGQAKEKFISQWTQEDMMRYLAEQKRKQAELQQNGKRDIEQLKASLDSLKQQSQTNQRVLSERLDKMRERKEEVEHLLSDSDALLREKESNSNEHLELKNSIVQEREALKTQDKSTKEKLEEFEKASVWFKDRLGLQFKKTPGERLQVIFTCVDHKDPSRPFYFSVKIESGIYFISDCQPEVDGLDDLVKKLNATNNFRSFITCMRTNFKALVS